MQDFLFPKNYLCCFKIELIRCKFCDHIPYLSFMFWTKMILNIGGICHNSEIVVIGVVPFPSIFVTFFMLIAFINSIMLGCTCWSKFQCIHTSNFFHYRHSSNQWTLNELIAFCEISFIMNFIDACSPSLFKGTLIRFIRTVIQYMIDSFFWMATGADAGIFKASIDHRHAIVAIVFG